MLRTGDLAPDFEGVADGGQKVLLSDFRGRKVILYFYPKDGTPGCMLEACSFRNLHEEFKARNAVILGISADSLESHDRFKKRHKLPFPLLSDPQGKIASAYGVWREKKVFGVRLNWPSRTTFIIGEEGRIEAIYDSVNVFGHASRVLEEVTGPLRQTDSEADDPASSAK